MKKTHIILIAIFVTLILALSLRGLHGNPDGSNLNGTIWKENGPFELSPERGRFALLYSVIEDHSLQFSNQIGEFAIPDVGMYHGHYVSLFAPLLSFIAIPGYLIGKFFGASQVGTFAIISIFALINLILIRAIAIRLGANSIAATIAGSIFLFATPAFSYAVNLYQHHISTFLILLSIYVLLKSSRVWTFIVVFFLCAAAIPLDYPNLFFMAPIGVFAIGKIISLQSIRNKISLKINFYKSLTILVMLIPIIFFLLFNKLSYGSPFQLSGTLPSVRAVQDSKDLSSISSAQTQKKQQQAAKKSAIGFFQTRNILNGFYLQFISPDRGIIYYTPVILFGIIGFIYALKKKVKMTTLLISIIGANVLLYSMWGDPWGGWAFGSRYLIPSYAILAIFIALLLTYWQKKILFVIPFILIAFYSIAVNTLGAITTSAMPPQVEVLGLEKISGMVQKYTYARNWDLILAGNSKSFVFQTFAKGHLSALQYYEMLVILIFLSVGGLITYFSFFQKEVKNV